MAFYIPNNLIWWKKSLLHVKEQFKNIYKDNFNIFFIPTVHMHELTLVCFVACQESSLCPTSLKLRSTVNYNTSRDKVYEFKTIISEQLFLLGGRVTMCGGGDGQIGRITLGSFVLKLGQKYLFCGISVHNFPHIQRGRAKRLEEKLPTFLYKQMPPPPHLIKKLQLPYLWQR